MAGGLARGLRDLKIWLVGVPGTGAGGCDQGAWLVGVAGDCGRWVVAGYMTDGCGRLMWRWVSLVGIACEWG